MEILILAHDVAAPGMKLMDDAIPVHLVKSAHPYFFTQIGKVLSKNAQVCFLMLQRSDLVADARKRVYPAHNDAHDRHIPFLLMAELDGFFQLISEGSSIPKVHKFLLRNRLLGHGRRCCPCSAARTTLFKLGFQRQIKRGLFPRLRLIHVDTFPNIVLRNSVQPKSFLTGVQMASPSGSFAYTLGSSATP